MVAFAAFAKPSAFICLSLEWFVTWWWDCAATQQAMQVAWPWTAFGRFQLGAQVGHTMPTSKCMLLTALPVCPVATDSHCKDQYASELLRQPMIVIIAAPTFE
jgi:hypothetical protein